MATAAAGSRSMHAWLPTDSESGMAIRCVALNWCSAAVSGRSKGARILAARAGSGRVLFSTEPSTLPSFAQMEHSMMMRLCIECRQPEHLPHSHDP